MPRYQLVVLWDAFSLLASKKPSAYLPLSETSLSLMDSAWPAEMVFVVAELAGMCREKSSAMARWRLVRHGGGSDLPGRVRSALLANKLLSATLYTYL
jgi:hypothetical protein